MKNIPFNERLIVAFDMESVEEALEAWANIRSDAVWVKIGFHLISDPDAETLIGAIKRDGGKILSDLKSIRTFPALEQNVRRMERLGVDALSIHYAREVLAMARTYAVASSVVTPILLTSMSREDIERDTGTAVDALVVDRARTAITEQNFTGVITSGQELKLIREELGYDFVAIVPGIRDDELAFRSADDQKRTVSLESAFTNGADYVLIGRPITSSDNPGNVVRAIQKRIEKILV
ncbi:orotidine-5'-phosphate decarboxylase [uncultured Roseobacter sp.]|uniref:orotidine-5'-phosphate decarboxylase n=1 Tax=uncultured Roseobacter sp. TaxID=114847 RepID=UPI0026383F8E|nr:orotidine-5'-phosphate decarboxylase [uncultured Roseobacter sp.]